MIKIDKYEDVDHQLQKDIDSFDVFIFVETSYHTQHKIELFRF